MVGKLIDSSTGRDASRRLPMSNDAMSFRERLKLLDEIILLALLVFAMGDLRDLSKASVAGQQDEVDMSIIEYIVACFACCVTKNLRAENYAAFQGSRDEEQSNELRKRKGDPPNCGTRNSVN